MRYVRLILFLFITFQCFAFSTEPAITIDNHKISSKEFHSLFDQFMDNYKSYLSFRSDELGQDEVNQIKKAVLDELLEDNITKKYASKHNIIISEKEVQKKVEEIMKGFPDAKTFWKILKDQRTSFDDLISSLKKELLKEKIIEVVVTVDLAITTEDILENLQHNTAGSSIIEYNISLLVTDNEKHLLSLIKNPNINWDRVFVNKKFSLHNETITEKDLPDNINYLLNDLPVGQYSPILSFDKENLFALKINSFYIDFTNIPEHLYSSILNEKKNKAYNAWLKENILRSTITLNQNIFPSADFNIYDDINDAPNPDLDFEEYVTEDNKELL